MVCCWPSDTKCVEVLQSEKVETVVRVFSTTNFCRKLVINSHIRVVTVFEVTDYNYSYNYYQVWCASFKEFISRVSSLHHDFQSNLSYPEQKKNIVPVIVNHCMLQ